MAVHFVLLVSPPAAFYYDLDEWRLTKSCLDQFLGLPSAAMEKPAAILHLLFVPIFFADFLVRRGIPVAIHAQSAPGLAFRARLLVGFSRYFADAFVDPRHHTTLLRAVVAVIACLAPVFLFAISRKMGATRPVSLLCALTLLFHPTVFLYSLMAAGDAAALTALLGAIFLILHGDRERWSTIAGAGFLFAAVAAFKWTMTSGGLVLLAFIYLYPPAGLTLRRAVQTTLRFAAGFALGLLMFLPYLWTDPLHLAKKIFVNLSGGGQSDVGMFFVTLRASAGIGFLVFAAIVLTTTVVKLRGSPTRNLNIALLISGVAMAIPLMLKSSLIYDRYFIPLSLIPLFCLLLIETGLPRSFVPALALLVLIMGATLIQRQIEAHAPDDLVEALKAIPQLPPRSQVYLPQVYIPEDAAATYVVRLPQSEYRRIALRAQEQVAGERGIKTFLAEHGVPQAAMGVLAISFNESERANAMETAVAAQAESPPSNWDVFLYRTSFNSERLSWADVSMAEAVASLNGDVPVALLLPIEQGRAELGKPVWQGRDWSWYSNVKAQSPPK